MAHRLIDLTGSKILIVDDQVSGVDLLRKTLESNSYRISMAQNGERALQLAGRIPPSLILLDVQMPGISGFETCRRLKENESTQDIPVIFITGHNDSESILEGFQAGGVDYITKPFQPKEVNVRVQTHLSIKRLQDELKAAHDELESAHNALENAYDQLQADNARKTEELERAREIQLDFLPIAVPEVPFLEIAAFQKPATEVGGDYYDFFSQTNRDLVVAIGDATGHGVGPGLMVSATRTALMTVEAPDLVERVSQINTILKRVNRNRLLNMALVLLELDYDADARTVQVKAAGGGMPPFYILRASGLVEEISIRGMLLGAMTASKYRARTFHLNNSDALILMSDGLPERLNDRDEMLDSQRLRAKIENVGRTTPSAAEILDALVQFGDDWSNETPQTDDVTLAVLKVKQG